MVPWWAVALLGAAGGLINAVLVTGGKLEGPRLLRRPGGGQWRRIVDLGSFANVIVGMGTAFLSYFFAPGTATMPQQLGLAFAGGIGGASLITNWMQKNDILLLTQERDTLAKAIKTDAKK